MRSDAPPGKAPSLPCRARSESGRRSANVRPTNNVLPFRGKRLAREEQQKAWSVCPHLADPTSLFDYYAGSGSIMLILGKCLCHACNDSILAKKDLTDFMESCNHLTDRGFQEELLLPLLQANKEVFRTRNHLTGSETTDWTWIGCPHISDVDDLQQLYTSCHPIFFQEGFITCDDCLEVVPAASMYLQLLMGCEAMTDAQMQERVFKKLYPINRGIVTAVRSHS